VAYNPSYSGGRDQEDRGSKASLEIVSEILSWKNPSQKRADGVVQGVAPSSNLSTKKKKKMIRMAGSYAKLHGTPLFHFLDKFVKHWYCSLNI
jgi:hypothetical protein